MRDGDLKPLSLLQWADVTVKRSRSEGVARGFTIVATSRIPPGRLGGPGSNECSLLLDRDRSCTVVRCKVVTTTARTTSTHERIALAPLAPVPCGCPGGGRNKHKGSCQGFLPRHTNTTSGRSLISPTRQSSPRRGCSLRPGSYLRGPSALSLTSTSARRGCESRRGPPSRGPDLGAQHYFHAHGAITLFVVVNAAVVAVLISLICLRCLKRRST